MKALHLKILLSHFFSTCSYKGIFWYVYVIGIKINKKAPRLFQPMLIIFHWIFRPLCLLKPPEYALIILNTLDYAWICLNNQSSEYARILNVSDAVPWKSKRFLRKSKKALLYDPQKHHLKAFRSQLQGLALRNQMIIFT